ncbi:MAG: transporter ATP-binding protein [Acidimicrobiales bacterium]|nr:transporter ATP-binding protein [Acidimicrobiales bacterium]
MSDRMPAILRRSEPRRARRHVEGAGAAVSVRGLTKCFGETAVLDGVDLDLAPGEFAVVTGPSGSGKSTLMHLLAALDHADAGTIVVNGVDVTRLHQPTRYRRFDIGLVFQLHNLVPRLTAEQNVMMAMFGTHLARTERRARARHLLDEVGLGHRWDHKPPTMSGGERQRVAIARAIANRPPVLLADEPTGSLDDDSAAGVVELFARLQSEAGVTVLAVSHDPRFNVGADRVLRLAQGRVTPLDVQAPATRPEPEPAAP